MSSSGNQNVNGDVAGSSSWQIGMEEQYRLMALESQQEDGEYQPSDDDDADDDCYWLMAPRKLAAGAKLMWSRLSLCVVDNQPVGNPKRKV
jgi:hypothetical protein